MIITRLSGGIGNQMFQYAAGKALADYNNCQLYLDTSYYKKNRKRSFLLNKFNISANEISEYSLYSSLNSSLNFFKDKITGKKRFNSSHTDVYSEPFFHYDELFFSHKSPCILNGYWQSEKYFQSIKDIIRNEFTLGDKFIQDKTNLATEIRDCRSVAIHLRRGDYLKDQFLNDIHGILPDEYYLSAIAKIKSLTSINRIYVFSDDPQAADAFINKSGIGINVSSRINDTLTEFHLFSLCNHQIIANSTFSWWSAWLNNYINKVVIAPSRWFNENSKNTKDIFPENWIIR